MKRKVLALACTLALSAGLLAGCGSSTDTAAEAVSYTHLTLPTNSLV